MYKEQQPSRTKNLDTVPLTDNGNGNNTDHATLLSVKDIAARLGFTKPDSSGLEVLRQKIRTLAEADPTIVPCARDGKKYLYGEEVAQKIIEQIGSLKTRKNKERDPILPGQKGSSLPYLENPEPPDHVQKEKEGELDTGSRRQARRENQETIENLKQQMPIYFTNEVLAHMGELDKLNRNVHVILDRALKKVNAGNGNIKLKDIFWDKSPEDTREFFISNFTFTLQKGLYNTKNPQDLSEQEKELIGHCDRLKKLYLSEEEILEEKILRDVEWHFGFTSSGGTQSPRKTNHS